MPDGPWTQYAPAASGPWEKYANLPAGEPETSVGEALWCSLWEGLGDPGVGAIRLGARAVGETEAVDQAAARREEAFKNAPTTRQHPMATGLGETAGEMAAFAPAAALGTGAVAAKGIGTVGKVLWDSLMGGGAGAVGAAESAPTNKFAPSVAAGAGLGAATGGALSAGRAVLAPPAAASAAAGRTAMPSMPGTATSPQTWGEAARMLTQRGVRLSPAQAINMSEAERSLQTWPILRSFVRGDVGRSLDDFNRATVAQSLEPIGGVVPRSIKAGHDLIDFATKRLGEAYDRVLPKLTLNRAPLSAALQNDPELMKFAAENPEDATKLMSILQQRFLSRFDKATGEMNGRVFKEAESDLAGRANRMAGGINDEMAYALKHALGVIRDDLAIQNPQFGPELQKINQGFAMFSRIRDAANRNVDSKGKFTPHDMLAVLRREDPSSGGNSFARGRLPMQAFAEAGNEVMGPSLTNRALEPTHSAARAAGDVLGGSLMTAPYLALRTLHRIPGAGRAAGIASPGIAADIGHRMTDSGPPALRKVGDTGPLGGTVTSSTRIEPPKIKKTSGLLVPGNIDLANRPIVKNADGSYSTVRSMSFNEDGKEVLIPTVADNGSRILSDREAIAQYRRTGKFLGKFSTPSFATAYAKKLHEQQAKIYDKKARTPAEDYIEPPP